MGAVNFSIDVTLAGILARELSIKTFVETGTFNGDSIASISDLFKEIHTCELSTELHKAATSRFENYKYIHCHQGSSSELLAKLSNELKDKPILYWLDAHWCSADHTAGEESQCPLLEELDAIFPLHENSVVWIDDARYFMSPPTKPLVMEGWPMFHEVQKKLFNLGGNSHRVTFANDTILLYPNKIGKIICSYLYENGVDWLQIAHEARIILPEVIKARDAYKQEYQKLKSINRASFVEYIKNLLKT